MSEGIWQWDRRGWHVSDDGATYLIARRVPLRWDMDACARLPDMGRRRLAHAVRQDLWRALQNVRGFAPAVSVTRDGQGLLLRAGGQASGPVPVSVHRRLGDLLEDRGHRVAWQRSARHR